METTTHIPLAADGVAMVQSALRDKMVWRDGSAAADGLKPTATLGGRSATKDKNQRVGSVRPILNDQVGDTAKVGNIPSHDRRTADQCDRSNPKIIRTDAQFQHSQILEAVDGLFRE